jgi:hypothetical protein
MKKAKGRGAPSLLANRAKIWWLAVLAPGALACSSASSLGGAPADASPSSAESAPPDVGAPLESGSDAEAGRLGDGSGRIAATMNDVSILFPLPSSVADIDDLLAPSATGAQGTLFPSALYSAMGPIFGSTEPGDGGPLPGPENGFAAYGDLRVTAIRVDPCFASPDPDPAGVGCTAQIRLVFQEVTWEARPSINAFAVAADSALHAFYDLSRADFLALASALVALRVTNEDGDALGPLAPHPIMVRQGLEGAMSQSVQHLILEYAGEQNLVRTAQVSGTSLPFSFGSWSMSAFDVTGTAPLAIPRTIPTLISTADGGSLVIQGVDGANDGVSFDPATTSADNFTSLWQISEAVAAGTDAGGLSPSDHQGALDALVRVENPKDNSANTIDCASCHLATDTEQVVAMPLLSFDDTTSPLAFQPDGTNVTPGDMATTFAPGDAPFGVNTHVFSYVGSSPAISQRVVNETAAVVEYLNDLPP